MIKGLLESGLPIELMTVEGGYFLMMDVSKCRELIPEKYFKSHEYEEGDPSTFI